MFSANIDSYYDIECQLPDYLKKLAKQYFEAESNKKLGIHTIQQFEACRRKTRDFFLSSIGGLENVKTPLNTICTGSLKYDGYTIEKIIYESYPGFYVTSNLYLPETCSGEKHPGILFACGHSDNGKAEPAYQRVCIDLVINGFVVLAVDPLGQGERVQYYDSETGTSSIGIGTREHSYAGLQCELTGSNIARYFIHDLIRGLDYLSSHPAVDPERLGMCGNSGGGTQTSYIMLVDERLKAAAPSCYINSRENYMKTGQAHDNEQNIFGSIAYGLNHDDFITAFAPKPVLINSARYDFFCIEGAVKSFERAKKIYEIYGKKDLIEMCISDSVHGYSDVLRQSTVNFFRKHLKNQKPDFITSKNIPTEKDNNLLCTKSGQILTDYENAKTVFDLNLEYFSNNRYKNEVGAEGGLEFIKERVIKVMNFPQPLDEREEIIYDRVVSDKVIDGRRYEKIFFFSEEDIAVDGIYITPEGRELSEKNCTILLLEEGTNALENEKELINHLLDNGSVFVFDPRGMGAAKSRKVNPRGYNDIYGTEYKLNSDAMMMGTSLAALRIYDVIRAHDYVKRRLNGIIPGIAGKGVCSFYALVEAILVKDVQSIYLKDPMPSFEEIVKTKFYQYNCKYDIFSVLKEFDIPWMIDELKKAGYSIIKL
ncbi:MAG TPA: acetylxylan esterase [Clostridiales bacterium]|nr:acetylxylan esterase [Clostridiales bacterium]